MLWHPPNKKRYKSDLTTISVEFNVSIFWGFLSMRIRLDTIPEAS